MSKIREEDLNMVNGGGLIKEMADKLTDSLNPQNG